MYVYVYADIKRMYPPGYHYNGFVAADVRLYM